MTPPTVIVDTDVGTDVDNAIALALRGVAHAISVPGPETPILLVPVRPNEDAADETVEGASLWVDSRERWRW
jgi:hypothetical protein